VRLQKGSVPATAQRLGRRRHGGAVIHAPTGFTRDEVMTATEVADPLHLPVSTVCRLPNEPSSRPDGLSALGDSCAQRSKTCSARSAVDSRIRDEESGGVRQRRGR